jgi:hypothetical protein
MTTNNLNSTEKVSETSCNSNKAQVDSSLVVQGDSACPVCACSIAHDEAQVACEHCSTPHHDDCWEYAGGCAIFGCRKNAIQKSDSSADIQEATSVTDLRVMGIWQWFVKIKWMFLEGMVSAIIWSLLLWSAALIFITGRGN